MITILKEYLVRTLLKLGYVIKINKELPNPIKKLAEYRTTPLEQKCLFLLTLGYSGSTVIGRFICKSNKIYGLDANYEGIKIISKLLRGIIFTNDKVMIAAIWAMRIAELKAEYQTLEYIFDKSYFLTKHYQGLLTMIPNTKLVANIRNPYATIASRARRLQYHYLNQKQQQIKYQKFITEWITYARLIRKAVTEDNIPLVTYEQFCADPLQIITAFGLDKTEFATDIKVQVKDYLPQPIINMNKTQIALLTDWQKEIINEQLSKETDLLTAFDYQLLH